jgi:hypothetical protein
VVNDALFWQYIDKRKIMPTTAIAIGVLLILIGVLGYVIGMSSGGGSLTALIPAIFGLVIAGAGFVARSNEGMRKHMMHLAAGVALIGFLVTAARIVPRLGEMDLSSPAALSQITMSLLCLIFVILAVKSFIDARKAA